MSTKVRKVCATCHKEFEVWRYKAERSVHCSKTCLLMNRKRVKKTCSKCGREFEVYKYRESTALYCSRRCSAQHRIVVHGHPSQWTKDWGSWTWTRTDKGKNRMRKIMVGNTWGFKKGHTPWNRDKKWESMSGSRHWNWKGGITKESTKLRTSPEYKNWRRAIFRRDFYMCQMPGCWKKSPPDLEAHHIQTVHQNREGVLDIANGISLCRECHNRTRKNEAAYEALFKRLVLLASSFSRVYKATACL